jgi:hypothetical protein
MAAPFPPQGAQTPRTERPLKIYGEQYLEGQALPIGAVIDPLPAPGFPPLYADGQPRVPLSTGWVVVHVTDWVISNRYTGRPIEVISAEEFAERFGPSEDA